MGDHLTGAWSRHRGHSRGAGALDRQYRHEPLPAIIPHGRGEGERFVYSCYGDVWYSVSQYTTKTFTASLNNVKIGDGVTIDKNIALDGYIPLAVTYVSSNHTASCSITHFGLIGDRLITVVANHEYINKGTWPTLTVTATVLYVKKIV